MYSLLSLLALLLLLITGTDFTVEGFKCILEYLYTGAVPGVTTTNSNSNVDADKVKEHCTSSLLLQYA
jgi:hypothetical protein